MSIRDINKAMDGCKNLRQAIRKMCGEFIGSGVYRDVYVSKQDPKYVVKIERDPSTGAFANVTEWRNWCNNKDWKFLAEWLAPCVLINEVGNVLVQRRVNWEGKKKKDYPKEIPGILTDTKYSNFGWIGDRFVCCDYAFFLVYFITVGGKKMRRAKWWDSKPYVNKKKK